MFDFEPRLILGDTSFLICELFILHDDLLEIILWLQGLVSRGLNSLCMTSGTCEAAKAFVLLDAINYTDNFLRLFDRPTKSQSQIREDNIMPVLYVKSHKNKHHDVEVNGSNGITEQSDRSPRSRKQSSYRNNFRR